MTHQKKTHIKDRWNGNTYINYHSRTSADNGLGQIAKGTILNAEDSQQWTLRQLGGNVVQVVVIIQVKVAETGHASCKPNKKYLCTSAQVGPLICRANYCESITKS